MTNKEMLFDEVVQETIQSCLSTLVDKGREYRRDGNPFHNFEKGMRFDAQKSREEIIWGFALKHFISVQDMREDVKKGNYPKLEVINEKYGDLINYLLIEKASIVDKINSQLPKVSTKLAGIMEAASSDNDLASWNYAHRQ